MAANRSDGQTLLSVAVTVEMLAAIDAKRGTTPRSVFVRESLAAYLHLPASLAAAPDRSGKGGRPKKTVLKPVVEEGKKRRA
jgi:hypothetical protein